MPLSFRRSILPLLLLAPGCGGGGGGGGGGNGNSKSLRLEAAIDRTGVVYDSGTVFNISQQNVVVAGDDANNIAIRALVSIVLSQIPVGATIDSAVLNVQAYVPFGTPYAEFGSLVMDHMDIGAGFNAVDFAGGTLTGSYATLANVAATNFPGQLVNIDVTSALLADLAAFRPTSTFRFKFSLAPSLDASADMFWITADLAVPLTLPHVVITYH